MSVFAYDVLYSMCTSVLILECFYMMFGITLLEQVI